MQAHQSQLDIVVGVAKKIGIKVKGVIDAGARDCTESIAFKKTFPEAEVVAFECNPANLERCREAVKGTGVRLVEKALSDREGTLDFHLLPEADNGSSSLYPHKELASEIVKVQATTLIKEIDRFPTILWIDAQGSELSIMKGCGERIREISLIHTEVYFRPAYVGQPRYKDIKAYLKSKGFRLLMFTSVPNGFSDALFVNEDIKKPLPSWLIEANEFTFKRVVNKIRRMAR